MKANIHPDYQEVAVTCSCGHKFTTRSTHKGSLKLDICSECHPFYTGQQKFIDTSGRLERFKRRYGAESSKG